MNFVPVLSLMTESVAVQNGCHHQRSLQYSKRDKNVKFEFCSHFTVPDCSTFFFCSKERREMDRTRIICGVLGHLNFARLFFSCFKSFNYNTPQVTASCEKGFIRWNDSGLHEHCRFRLLIHSKIPCSHISSMTPPSPITDCKFLLPLHIS